MKIHKFRIKNYKSIVDSGDCYLEQDLTIFAGKNESGKTSILEALENFNPSKNIPENAKSIGVDDIIPEISLTLTMTNGEVAQYYSKINSSRLFLGDLKMEITKKFPDVYFVDSSASENLDLANYEVADSLKQLENNIEKAYQEIVRVNKRYILPHNGHGVFLLNLNDINNTKKQLDGYLTNYNHHHINYIADINIRNAGRAKIQELKGLLDNYLTVKSLDPNSNWNVFFKMLPNFILFKSFEDIVPNEVPFADLEKNEFIKDLEIISNLDVALIKSVDSRGKLQHHKAININLNEEYSKFWLQDLTEIKIHWDNGVLQFWIEEDSKLFKPSERSKGKQWHMSFYIKITARAIEDKSNIILIDEPGLYLHATAQKDIYNKLIDRSKKSQILYTTHSPYLLNRDELHRVRLVMKNNSKENSGTIIENKIHAKADKETLTPILTAIGLGLNDGIQNINQLKNVVIEGPADYFYLEGFKKLFKELQINPVFGGGSGNMGNVGAILTGWGCKVIYLFDNDQGKKNGSKNLIKNWMVPKDLILGVKEDSGTIEDIFEKRDFQINVLKDETSVFNTSNSQYLKDRGFDKVLLARQFNALCNTGENMLSEESSTRIKKVFDNLEQIFESIN